MFDLIKIQINLISYTHTHTRRHITYEKMSYTELESGYQGLKQNRPGFYVGHDGNLISLVSLFKLFFFCI